MITSLINERLICLQLQARSKAEVFTELATRLAADGRVNDVEQFVADLWAREEIDNTGFEEGIALPHAKSAAVTTPAVAIGISRDGIDYGAQDGQPSHLFFMIASPANGANQHVEVLAELSSRLIEEGFIKRLLAAPTPAAAAEHPRTRALLTKLVDQVAEVLHVPALVRRHGHAVGVLFDGGLHHVGHAAVMTQMNHLGALRLQHSTNHRDRGVVPVEKAGRGDDAHRRGSHAAIDSHRTAGVECRRRPAVRHDLTAGHPAALRAVRPCPSVRPCSPAADRP